MKQKIKQWITIPNLLYLFIILCPILDMVSYWFRNFFQTNFSPSTFLRPIIPILVACYIFWKGKEKKKLLGIGAIYALYAVLHLVVFQMVKTRKQL